MAGSNLKVTLELAALFGNAAAEAAKNLESIADRIDELGRKKSVFVGLQDAARALDSELTNIEDRLSNLSMDLGNVGAKAEGTSRSVSAARVSINDMGNAASTASVKVAGAATAAADLGNKAGKIKDVAEAVGAVAGVSDSAKKAFEGLLGAVNQADKGSLSSLMAATRQLEQQAKNAGGAFRNLRQEIEDMNRAAVGMANPSRQVALNPAQPLYPQLTNYSGPTTSTDFPRDRAMDAAYEAQRALGSSYRPALTGNTQYSGVSPNPIPTDFGRNQLMPYMFSPQAEDAPYVPPNATNAKFRNTRASDYFNSGRTANADYTDLNPQEGSKLVGPSRSEAEEAHWNDRRSRFKDNYRMGDKMQSGGFGAVFNATMLGGWIPGAFQSGMRVEQLDTTNEISARANNATPQTVKTLADMAHNNTRLGGDYSDVIAGMSSYITTMSPHVDINDKQWQQTMRYATDRASKVAIISQATNSPVSNQAAQFGMNQVIANLGFDTSTPQALGKASEAVTNMLAKMKSVSPSGIPDTLAFIKNLGPVAANTNQRPEDIAALIYALGKGKIIGGVGGNAMKRLFQRETLPTPTTTRLQDTIKKDTGIDLKLFDNKGGARSILDVVGQLAELDQKHHMSDRTRASVTGQLSGLYAGAPVSQLLSIVEKNGGAAGIRKQGDEIMHKGIAGSKKDAVGAESDEQFKTAANASQRAANAMKDAWQKVYKDLEPAIIGISGLVGKMADAFGSLPAPVRDGAAALGIIGIAATAFIGINAILIGNTIKAGAGILEFASKFAIGRGAIDAFGKVFSGLGNMIGFVADKTVGAFGRMVVSIVRVGIIEPVMGAARAAMLAFGISTDIALGPVIAGVALVGLAVGAMWLAWHSNLGNCQGYFAQFVKGVSGFIGEAEKRFHDFQKTVGGVIDWVKKAISSFWDGFTGVLSKVDDVLYGGLGKKALAASEKLASELAKGAQKGGDALKKHIGEAADTAKKKMGELGDAIHSGVNKIGKANIFGVGPPTPTTNTASYGNNGAAATTVPNIAEDPGLGADVQNALHPPKKGKKAKVVYDSFVNIHDLPESEVEAAARKLEAQWKSKHVKLKPGWFDLKNESGQVVDREFGDKAAWNQAVKNLAPDKGLKEQIENYLKQAKFFRTGTEQEITALEGFLKKAKTQGLKAYIESEIADLNKVELGKIAKGNETFTRVHKELYGEGGSKAKPDGGFTKSFSDNDSAFDSTIDKANKSYRELWNSQKEGLVTAAELKQRYDLLFSTVDSLTTEYDKSTSAVDSVTARIKEETDAMNAITGSTRAAQQARAAWKATIDSEKATLGDLNSKTNLQKIALDQVTASQDKANIAYQKAIDFQKTLAYQFQQAKIAAQQAVTAEGGSLLANGANQLFHNVTQGPRSGGAVGQMVSSYVSGYINQIAGPLAKELMPGGKQQQTQQTEDIKGNQKLETIGTSLDDAKAQIKSLVEPTTGTRDNTNVFKGMQQTAGSALPVSVASSYASGGGNTAGGLSTSSSGADMSNASFGDWGDTKKNTDIFKSQAAKTIKGIAGAAASTIAGIEQGGVGGAVTAGVGTYASLASAGVPPQVAIPVAAVSAGIALFTHHDNPAAMPDKFDTQNYGQGQADIIGSGFNGKGQNSANGYSFVEDNQTAVATNNMGMLQYVQQWSAANLNNSDASIAKQAQDDALKYGTYNPNAKSGNDLLTYDPKNIGNETVIGGTEKGSYTSIENDLSTATNSIQALSSASLQAAQNAKALADSFTANLMGGPSGFSMPYLGSVGAGNASSSFLTNNANAISAQNSGIRTGSLPGSQAVGTQISSSPTIRILEGATVQDGTDVVNAITNALPAITAAINQANYNQARYAQGYQSQLS